MSAIGFSLGLVLYFAFAQTARKRGKQAYDILGDRQKLAVVDGFTNTRMRVRLPGVILLIGLVCGLHFLRSHALWVLLTFLGLNFVWLVIAHRQIKAKLRELELPEKYVTAVLKARRLSHIGIILMLLCILGGAAVEGVRRAARDDARYSDEGLVERDATQMPPGDAMD